VKLYKACEVVLVTVLSGSLLVGCTSENATTATSTTRAPATPSVSASSPGSITVALKDLVGHEGEHVAGVLLKVDYPGPEFTGVGGFVTQIDSDPFTQQHVLGNVPAEFPDEADPMGWPWPTGVANVPPGHYTLKLWAGKDNFCCYSRWMPAGALTHCQVEVTATGEPQTITITGVSNSFVGICTTM
jgi:hypothetical protein